MSTPDSSSNWIVAIAVALIGLAGVLGAAYIANRPRPEEPPDGNVGREHDTPTPAPTHATPPANDSRSASQPTPAPCLIGGRVYNDDDPEKGVPKVRIRYYSSTQPDSRNAPVYLVTNKPDGTFTSRCPDVPPEQFPLKLMLTNPAWGDLQIDTEDLITPQGNTDLSFYVSPNEIDQNARQSNPRAVILARPAPANPRAVFERRPNQ
ncbi:MAG TPA: hypothetical protein VF546_18380 [Pyrinomonadaceae bacterium]|jgi:hypothetical protein